MTASAAYPVWGDPAAWRNPPALDGDVEADVCVVGLGGSGLAAVGAALEQGASVVGIDAGPIAGGAAGRNGGFLLAGGALFHHAAVDAWGEERAVGIYRESLAELDRLAAELGPIVRRVGSHRIPASPEEAEDCALQLAALERHGFPARAADGPTGAGVFIPGDGSVQPLERCRLLAERALAAGARLFCDTPAVAVQGTRVDAPAGVVRCRAVVVCVDGWLERLLPELDGQVRSSRLQMLATAPVEPGRIPCPVYDNWGYEYWQQLPDGSVALGGGRGIHGDGEWGREAEPGSRGPGAAGPAPARARGRRRGGHAPLGRRDLLHARPAAGVRRGPARRARGRRPLGTRQRAGLGGGPRGDGDRPRRARSAARTAPASRALGLTSPVREADHPSGQDWAPFRTRQRSYGYSSRANAR